MPPMVAWLASKRKAGDSKLLKSKFGDRCCTLCDHTSHENTIHMVMQCQYHEKMKIEMYSTIKAVGRELDSIRTYEVLIGRELEWLE